MVSSSIISTDFSEIVRLGRKIAEFVILKNLCFIILKINIKIRDITKLGRKIFAI